MTDDDLAALNRRLDRFETLVERGFEDIRSEIAQAAAEADEAATRAHRVVMAKFKLASDQVYETQAELGELRTTLNKKPKEAA